MLDIGFTELLLILFVSLVVLGPDRLPEVVKGITKLSRWIKTTGLRTKQELEKSIGINEIRQDLHNEEILKGLKEAKNNKKVVRK